MSLILTPLIKQINVLSLASSPVEGTGTATKVLQIQVIEKIQANYAIYLEVNSVSKARRLHDLWDA